MKYSEKMKLLLSGVKMEEIKALEEEEAKELEELKNEPEPDPEPEQKDPAPDQDIKSALDLVKELESKLHSKEDELTKLNKQFAEINNKRSVAQQIPQVKTAEDVMNELFNPKKEE